MTRRILKEAVYEFTEIFSILEDGMDSNVQIQWPKDKNFSIRRPKFMEKCQFEEETGRYHGTLSKSEVAEIER
jgi:hypothetical protein